jgi:hypothetical protein
MFTNVSVEVPELRNVITGETVVLQLGARESGVMIAGIAASKLLTGGARNPSEHKSGPRSDD